MAIQRDLQLINLLKTLARAASLLVILVGSLVLVGWAFDLAALKSFGPGLQTMKPNTAVAFIVAGGSLWLLVVPPSQTRRGQRRLKAKGFHNGNHLDRR